MSHFIRVQIITHSKEKTKEFLLNSSLKNLEDLVLNSKLCFNQNVPYVTIMPQDIKIIIEELIVRG